MAETRAIRFTNQERGMTMSRLRRALAVGVGIVALAVPAGAIAKHGESHGQGKGPQVGHGKQGKGKGQSRRGHVGYLFKGFYAGEGIVEVKRGNAHVRKAGLIGGPVEFDFSAARHIVVADTNADGMRSLEDVTVGDWVLVKSRLPRKDPGSQPFDARWLIDKTHPPVQEEEPAPGS